MMRGVSRLARWFIATLVLLTGFTALVPARPVAAAPARWCPPQAAPYCAENAFLDYWTYVNQQATPGFALDALGYPISPTLRAPSGLVVQFYERAVMEWHPENPPAQQVLLTRLGAGLIENDPHTRTVAAPCPPSGDGRGTCVFYAQTQHSLRGAFLNFHYAYGEVPVYGYPLTEEFAERNAANGKSYTVQYFERNRFEYHPENTDPRYQVLLGRLGAEFLATLGDQVNTWPVVATPTSAVAQPQWTQWHGLPYPAEAQVVRSVTTEVDISIPQPIDTILPIMRARWRDEGFRCYDEGSVVAGRIAGPAYYMRYEGGSPYTLYTFIQDTPGHPGITTLVIMTVSDGKNNDIGANPSAHRRCDP